MICGVLWSHEIWFFPAQSSISQRQVTDRYMFNWAQIAIIPQVIPITIIPLVTCIQLMTKRISQLCQGSDEGPHLAALLARVDRFSKNQIRDYEISLPRLAIFIQGLPCATFVDDLRIFIVTLPPAIFSRPLLATKEDSVCMILC